MIRNSGVRSEWSGIIMHTCLYKGAEWGWEEEDLTLVNDKNHIKCTGNDIQNIIICTHAQACTHMCTCVHAHTKERCSVLKRWSYIPGFK